jgi:hypothetical protein
MAVAARPMEELQHCVPARQCTMGPAGTLALAHPCRACYPVHTMVRRRWCSDCALPMSNLTPCTYVCRSIMHATPPPRTLRAHLSIFLSVLCLIAATIPSWHLHVVLLGTVITRAVVNLPIPPQVSHVISSKIKNRVVPRLPHHQDNCPPIRGSPGMNSRAWRGTLKWRWHRSRVGTLHPRGRMWGIVAIHWWRGWGLRLCLRSLGCGQRALESVAMLALAR